LTGISTLSVASLVAFSGILLGSWLRWRTASH